MIIKLISFVIIVFKSIANIINYVLLGVIEFVSVSIVSCEFFDSLLNCLVVVIVVIGIDSIMVSFIYRVIIIYDTIIIDCSIVCL